MRKFVGVVVVAFGGDERAGRRAGRFQCGGIAAELAYSRWPVRAWVAAQGDFLLPEDPRHQRGRLSEGSRALPERNRQGVSPQRSGEQQRCAARRRLRDEHDGHPPTNRPNGYSRTRGMAVAHHAERARLRHLLHGHAEAASASSGALSPYLSAICCSDRIGNFVHGLAPNGGPQARPVDYAGRA